MNFLIHCAWVKFYYSEYVSYICINLSYQGFIDFKMITFGKKHCECREAKGLSQKKPAKLLNTSYSVIGNYERDEMLPSAEAAKKIAKLIDTTVDYLQSETDQEKILKDTEMLKRLNEIEKMDKEDKNHILYTIDGLIKSVKLKNIAAL